MVRGGDDIGSWPLWRCAAFPLDLSGALRFFVACHVERLPNDCRKFEAVGSWCNGKIIHGLGADAADPNRGWMRLSQSCLSASLEWRLFRSCPGRAKRDRNPASRPVPYSNLPLS